MTLAFLHTLKVDYPGAKITLMAQPWMDQLISPGLIDRFIPLHLPWVGGGIFSVQKWKNFYRAVLALKTDLPTMACETRGDWRNFLFFWCLKIPVRVGVPLSGGARLLTHAAGLFDRGEPLYESRKSLLFMFGSRRPLQYPAVPKAAEINGIREPYVVVHPGASQHTRQMTISHMRLILQKMPAGVKKIVVATGSAELELQNKCLNFFLGQGLIAESWNGSLTEFLRICSQSVAVYAMDSGPAHLASWSGSSVMVFCSHDSPRVIAPLGRDVTYLEVDAGP
jgi:ADP-heptose:LPS heptosyltransferase